MTNYVLRVFKDASMLELNKQGVGNLIHRLQLASTQTAVVKAEITFENGVTMTLEREKSRG